MMLYGLIAVVAWWVFCEAAVYSTIRANRRSQKGAE